MHFIHLKSSKQILVKISQPKFQFNIVFKRQVRLEFKLQHWNFPQKKKNFIKIFHLTKNEFSQTMREKFKNIYRKNFGQKIKFQKYANSNKKETSFNIFLFG
jgi:hypothetical protein